MDFDNHIINGEINARGLTVGGHSTAGVNNNVRIDRLISISPNGVRQAEISIYDSISGQWIPKLNSNGTRNITSLFPEYWTPNRIKVEGCSGIIEL